MTTTETAARRTTSQMIGHSTGRETSSGRGRRTSGRRHSSRPRVAGVAYQGTGVQVSRTPHRGRPVSVATTAALAGLAALITVWLGSLGLARGGDGPTVTVPERLAVVQVRQGESLEDLAARVVPEAQVNHTVERIKSLNRLGSTALKAGQTLVMPIG